MSPAFDVAQPLLAIVDSARRLAGPPLLHLLYHVDLPHQRDEAHAKTLVMVHKFRKKRAR